MYTRFCRRGFARSTKGLACFLLVVAILVFTSRSSKNVVAFCLRDRFFEKPGCRWFSSCRPPAFRLWLSRIHRLPPLFRSTAKEYASCPLPDCNTEKLRHRNLLPC